MSAKKSKPISPELDFRHTSSSVKVPQVKSVADIRRLAANGTPAQKLVAQRTLLLAESLWKASQASRKASISTPIAAPGRRGRPKDEALERATRECEFDIRDMDRLREIGWGNVMTDQEVIDKAIARHWSIPNEPAQQDRKRTAIKVAVHRRRKAQS